MLTRACASSDLTFLIISFTCLFSQKLERDDTFQSSSLMISYSQKQKKPAELEKISSAGFGLFSGAGFCFLPKELLRCHTPMNGNIVAVVLPDLNPVNQLGDHQMLGFLSIMYYT